MNTRKLTKDDEQKFRSFCDYENITFMTGDEIVDYLAILNIKTSAANLRRNGIIESVYRGKVYRLTGKNGTMNDLLPRLFDKEESFYLTGVYAFNSYNFIDQLPSMYQVANRKIKEEKTIAGFRFIFKKVKEDYFYGIDSTSFTLTRERALIDFCYSYDYSRFFEVLTNQKDTIKIKSLIDYALKYPLNNIARRVLYGINSITPLSGRIKKQINKKSLITLNDTTSRKGTIDKEFNVIINQ